jgi:hypothetical protein
LLLSLLQWLLGLLGPNLTDKIQRPRRRLDLMNGIHAELDHHRYVLAALAYKLQSFMAEVDHDFINWILPILENYSGPDAEPALAVSYRKLLSLTNDQIRAIHIAMHKPGSAVGLKTYALPFLDSQVPSLGICEADYQRRVLQIKSHQELMNQDIEFARATLGQTFDPSITGANREAVVQNLEKSYRTIARKARELASEITALIEKHSPLTPAGRVGT